MFRSASYHPRLRFCCSSRAVQVSQLSFKFVSCHSRHEPVPWLLGMHRQLVTGDTGWLCRTPCTFVWLILPLQSTLDQLILSPLPSPPSRLVFSSAHKCKMWQERLLESLRRSVRTLKSTFAFVHRAYSRDQKMEGSQQCGPDPGTALHSLKGEGNSIKQFLPLPYTYCWCEVYIAFGHGKFPVL